MGSHDKFPPLAPRVLHPVRCGGSSDNTNAGASPERLEHFDQTFCPPSYDGQNACPVLPLQSRHREEIRPPLRVDTSHEYCHRTQCEMGNSSHSHPPERLPSFAQLTEDMPPPQFASKVRKESGQSQYSYASIPTPSFLQSGSGRWSIGSEAFDIKADHKSPHFAAFKSPDTNYEAATFCPHEMNYALSDADQYQNMLKRSTDEQEQADAVASLMKFKQDRASQERIHLPTPTSSVKTDDPRHRPNIVAYQDSKPAYVPGDYYAPQSTVPQPTGSHSAFQYAAWHSRSMETMPAFTRYNYGHGSYNSGSSPTSCKPAFIPEQRTYSLLPHPRPQGNMPPPVLSAREYSHAPPRSLRSPRTHSAARSERFDPYARSKPPSTTASATQSLSPVVRRRQSPNSQTTVSEDEFKGAIAIRQAAVPSSKNLVCHAEAECPENQNFRSAISHFFGRNKTESKALPELQLIQMCRKHYQRFKYQCDRDGNYHIMQAEYIRRVWNAAELREPNMKWTIALSKGLEQDYHECNRIRSRDPHAELRPSPDLEDKPKRSFYHAKQLMDTGLIDQMGENKTFADCRKFLSLLVASVDVEHGGPELPRVEFLGPKGTKSKASKAASKPTNAHAKSRKRW